MGGRAPERLLQESGISLNEKDVEYEVERQRSEIEEGGDEAPIL